MEYEHQSNYSSSNNASSSGLFGLDNLRAYTIHNSRKQLLARRRREEERNEPTQYSNETLLISPRFGTRAAADTFVRPFKS